MQSASAVGHVPAKFNANRTPRVGARTDNQTIYPMQGDINELVVFDRPLPTVQRRIIDNYLSAKYGLALAVSVGDLYAGDDVSNGAYKYDVIGVGFEDGVPHAMAGGAGLGLAIDGAATAGSYLLAGHKTLTNALTTADLDPDLHTSRWQRVWYLDKTGTLDASLTFDWHEAGLAEAMRPGLAYTLLFSTAAMPFAFQAVAADVVVDGERTTFFAPNNKLDSGYYTVGIVKPAPRSMVVVAATPEVYGLPTPTYGAIYGLTNNATLQCAMAAEYVTLEDGLRAHCVGYKLYTNSVGAALCSDDALEFAYTHSTNYAAPKLEWQWDVEVLWDLSAAAGGSVDGAGWHKVGAIVEANAVSDAGMSFYRWEGDLPPGYQRNAKITMAVSAPYSAVAHFIASPALPPNWAPSGPGGIGGVTSPSTLRLWLKGDDGVEQDDGNGGYAPAGDGDTVKRWRDQSGRDNHAYQNTAGSRPTLTNETLNGRAAINFTTAGGVTYFDLNHFCDFSEFTLFDVGRLHPDAPNKAGAVLGAGDRTKGPYFLLLWHGSGDQYWVSGRGNGTNNYQYLGAGPVRVPHCGAHRFEEGTGQGFHNGYLFKSSTAAGHIPGNFNTNRTPRVGADPISLASYPFWGYINELIVFDYALPTVQRRLIENYLSAKYDVPLDSRVGDLYGGDTPALGDYDLDVFGVGREDGATHAQAAVAGLGLVLDITAEETLGYLMAGHRAAVNTAVESDINNAKIKSRWSRVWYIDKAGTFNARLVFDWESADIVKPFLGQRDYCLLYSAANDPYEFTEVVTPTLVEGEKVVFAVDDFDLKNGFYTLGVLRTNPGTLLLLK